MSQCPWTAGPVASFPEHSAGMGGSVGQGGWSVLGWFCSHSANTQRQRQNPKPKKYRKVVTSHASGLWPQGGHPVTGGRAWTVGSGCGPRHRQAEFPRTPDPANSCPCPEHILSGAPHQEKSWEIGSSLNCSGPFTFFPFPLFVFRRREALKLSGRKSQNAPWNFCLEPLHVPGCLASRDGEGSLLGAGLVAERACGHWASGPEYDGPAPSPPALRAHPGRQCVCGGCVLMTLGDLEWHPNPHSHLESGTEQPSCHWRRLCHKTLSWRVR